MTLSGVQIKVGYKYNKERNTSCDRCKIIVVRINHTQYIQQLKLFWEIISISPFSREGRRNVQSKSEQMILSP